MSQPARKETVFEPCPAHASLYAAVSRYRQAEVMAEGGWASSRCPGALCQMRPGTDLFTAQFVTDHPVWQVRP